MPPVMKETNEDSTERGRKNRTGRLMRFAFSSGGLRISFCRPQLRLTASGIASSSRSVNVIPATAVRRAA
jgi:hypothetical protein